MNTVKFETIARRGSMTVAEVAVVGGSMLFTTKFLDFETLFKNQIEKDPTYKDRWFIRHQGAIKLVAGATAAAYVKNPWLKLLFIGVAANGFIQQTRVLTTQKDGTNFFNQIGNRNLSEMDNKLLAAAKNATKGTESPTFVASKGTESPTYVAGVDLMDRTMTSVGQRMQRGMGVSMERGVGCATTM